MARTALTLTLFFLILPRFYASTEKAKGLMSAIEEKLENKLLDYTGKFAEWLESLNDKHLGHSELGRFLHYEEMKTKVQEAGRQGRNMKKMAVGMLPLIFHVGATSTWMMVTAIMTAKSVAIGMLLLIFKIAVSSAKVASFFTALKNKHYEHHTSWVPHYEHHGHERSLSGIETHVPGVEVNSFHPSWSHHNAQEYKTLPLHKDYPEHQALHHEPHSDITYTESHVPGVEVQSLHPSWSHHNAQEYKTLPLHKDYPEHQALHHEPHSDIAYTESHVPGVEVHSLHPSWSHHNAQEYKTLPLHKDYPEHQALHHEPHPDISYTESHVPGVEVHSYHPSWPHDVQEYKTIPLYNDYSEHELLPDITYAGEKRSSDS